MNTEQLWNYAGQNNTSWKRRSQAKCKNENYLKITSAKRNYFNRKTLISTTICNCHTQRLFSCLCEHNPRRPSSCTLCTLASWLRTRCTQFHSTYMGWYLFLVTVKRKYQDGEKLPWQFVTLLLSSALQNFLLLPARVAFSSQPCPSVPFLASVWLLAAEA